MLEQPYWTFPVDIDVPLDKTALVVVDMQRWCAAPGSTIDRIARYRLGEGSTDYYFSRIHSQVIPNIHRFLAFFREHKLHIAYLTIGKETPDGTDLNRAWQVRNRMWAEAGNVPEYFPLVGTTEHAILEDIAPLTEELVINKTTAGAFNSSRFEAHLKALGIEALYFVGVVTNGCVGTTLRDASDRGYMCYLVEDACAAFSSAIHSAALLVHGPPLSRVIATRQALEKLTLEVREGFAVEEKSAC